MPVATRNLLARLVRLVKVVLRGFAMVSWRRLLYALAVLAWAVLGSVARADLVSLLLTPPNAVNDVLQDRSWRIELNNAGNRGSTGNVMYGVAAFDQLTVNGNTVTLNRSAWMVFSVTRAGRVARTFRSALGDFTLNGFDFSATSYPGYTLTDLLGISFLDNAMVALVELTIPYSSTMHLRQLVDDQYATKALLDASIEELKNHAKFIAAFGKKDAEDFYFMSDLDGSGQAKEFFGLSPVAFGTGVSPTYFTPLYQEADQRVDLSQFEFSLRDFMNVTLKTGTLETGVAAYYTDRGTILVNVVPEPASWISLLALGGLAAFYQTFRLKRRKDAVTNC